MPARKLYFEAVRVGDELPALAKAPVDRVQLVALRRRLGRLQPRARGRGLRQERGHAVACTRPGMLVMGFLGQLVSATGPAARSCGATACASSRWCGRATPWSARAG